VPPTKPTKEELREAYLKGIRDAEKGETHYASYSVKQLLQVLNAKARDTKDPRRELNIEYLKGVIHHVQSVAQKRLFMGGTLNGYIEAARATPLNHFTPKETIPPVQTEEKPKTGLASYIQAPYEIRKVDEHGNVWYWSPWHEGLILTKNLDPAEIQKIMKDFTDVVKATQNVLRTSPYIRRYYGFNLEEIERDVNFIRPATNLVINQDPERYFGAGSSGIRQRGIKVFWFTPEKSRDYLGRSSVLMPEGTPPGAAAHEITHTLGSSKEIIDPLSETVAIIFYLQHPEYLHESKMPILEGDIERIAGEYFYKTYKPGTAKEQIKAIYSAVPAKLQAILQQRFTPEGIKQILA
jgi:hypothetical protein